MAVGGSALGVLQRARMEGVTKVEGAQCSLGCPGEALTSDFRQSTYISPGKCLDLAALGFRDAFLETVGQIERRAEHPQLLVSSESGSYPTHEAPSE